MEAFLIILGVPLLGVMLFVAGRASETARTPARRLVARCVVLFIGVILGLIGSALLAIVVMWFLTGALGNNVVSAVLGVLSASATGLLLLWAARSAVHSYRSVPQEGLSADDPASLEPEKASQQLQLAAAALVFTPLLLLGVFGLALAVPLAVWGVAFWTARRARQAQFLWTMALAVRQDLPLADEVDEFAAPLWPKQRAAYYNLSHRLRDGQPLGEALERSPSILSRPIAGELRIAEEAGTLPQVLTEMAAQSTASLGRRRNDSTVAMTLMYGWALLAAFLCIVSFLMYWIIPKYKDIFNDFGVPLPPMTITTIKASDLVVSNFLFVMPIVGLPIVAILVAGLVYFVEWGNLNVPLVMRWFPRRDAPSLLRSLSHAVGAEQPLPQIVGEMSHRHLRSDMRSRLARISGALGGGEPLWLPLSNEGFIRPAEADALAAAQRAGNLPWAMRTLADSIERVASHRAALWMEILKPVVVVGVGLIVGWFVVSMFLPLVTLINKLA